MAPKEKKQAKDGGKIAADKTQKLAKPQGLVPFATILSRHGSTMVTREGKGFSMNELVAAGIPRNMAGRWGLQVDLRRRSSLEANVGTLRTWAAGPAQKVAKVGEVKKVEAEVAKVEKEVVHEVKKEAAKAKKGAKKVEKEVAAAVEKPLKARQRKKTTKGKQSA